MAGTILQNIRCTPEQLAELAGLVPVVGASELPCLLVPFSRSIDPASGVEVLGALSRARSLATVRPEKLKAAFEKYPAAVQTQVQQVIDLIDREAGQRQARLETLLDQLKDGDVRRGQAIFNSEKAACISCHPMGYAGGNLGPDLTTIGQARTERDLLEAILFPSASFVRSYEPVIVTTVEGDEHSGLLRKDAPDEVVLATGPQTEMHLARSDIAEMRPGMVSVMPEGFTDQLSRQELADLLAFLKNTRWGPQ